MQLRINGSSFIHPSMMLSSPSLSLSFYSSPFLSLPLRLSLVLWNLHFSVPQRQGALETNLFTQGISGFALVCTNNDKRVKILPAFSPCGGCDCQIVQLDSLQKWLHTANNSDVGKVKVQGTSDGVRWSDKHFLWSVQTLLLSLHLLWWVTVLQCSISPSPSFMSPSHFFL